MNKLISSISVLVVVLLLLIPSFINLVFTTQPTRTEIQVSTTFNVWQLAHSDENYERLVPLYRNVIIEPEILVEENVHDLEMLSLISGYSYEYLSGCTPEQRRQIESGGDYSINTGNGYLGAYQFDERYNAGRWEAAFGTPYPGHEAFLADSASQDALADWYANDRWGGWENVPSEGGW